MESNLFFQVFRNNILVHKIWSLVPEVNIIQTTRIEVGHYGDKVILGHSYSIKNMYLWNDTCLCRYRLIPLLKYLIELPAHVKEELTMVNGLLCFQLSFTSLQLFLRLNRNYDTYLFFYNRFEHVFSLGKKYLNKPRLLEEEKIKKPWNKKKELVYDVMVDACLAGNLQIIQHLVSVARYKVNRNNVLLLENACKSGSFELVKWLVQDQKVNVNSITPLLATIDMRRLDMLKCLHQQLNSVGNEFKIDYASPKDMPTLLDHAIRSESIEIIKYIVDNRTVEIQSQSIDYVFESGNKEIFDYLESTKNIIIDPKERIGHCWYQNCLDISIKSNNLEFITYVYGVLVHKYGVENRYLYSSQAFTFAVSINRVDILIYLLSKFPDIDPIPEQLFLSMCRLKEKKDRNEMATYLVDRFGLDSMIKYDSLIWACQSGDLELVKMVYQHLASTSPVSSFEVNMLFEKASESRSIEVMVYLDDQISKLRSQDGIKAKIELNPRTLYKVLDSAMPPFTESIIRIIDFLLDRTPSAGKLDSNDISMWSRINTIAIKSKSLEFIKMLVEKGVYVYSNLITLSAKHGTPEIVQYVVENCSKNQLYDLQWSLNESIKTENIKVIDWLVTKYPQLTLTTDCLHTATRYGDFDVLKYLYDKKRYPELTSEVSYVCLFMNTISQVVDHNRIGKRSKYKFLFESCKLLLESPDVSSSSPTTVSITTHVNELVRFACSHSSIPMLVYLIEYLRSPKCTIPVATVDLILSRIPNFVTNSCSIPFLKWICSDKSLVSLEDIKLIQESIGYRDDWNPEIYQLLQQLITGSIWSKVKNLFHKQKTHRKSILQKSHFQIFDTQDLLIG